MGFWMEVIKFSKSLQMIFSCDEDGGALSKDPLPDDLVEISLDDVSVYLSRGLDRCDFVDGRLMVLPPAQSELLQRAVTGKIKLLKDCFTADKHAHIIFNDHVYQADYAAINDMKGALMASVFPDNWPGWYDIDNMIGLSTRDELQALANEISWRTSSLMAKLQTLKTSLMACDTLDKVNAISWHDPKTFAPKDFVG